MLNEVCTLKIGKETPIPKASPKRRPHSTSTVSEDEEELESEGGTGSTLDYTGVLGEVKELQPRSVRVC